MRGTIRIGRISVSVPATSRENFCRDSPIGSNLAVTTLRLIAMAASRSGRRIDLTPAA